MTMAKQRLPSLVAPENYLDRAGSIILSLAIQGAQVAKQKGNKVFNHEKYQEQLALARSYLEKCNPLQDTHKFAAVQTVIEGLKTVEDGCNPIGTKEIFKRYVEAIHGGETDVSFGGRKITNKPSATQAYLKMAAIELWDHFPKKRDQLVNEARTILKIGTKKKLQKLRENFVERHDVEISKSKSPLSVHKKLVKDLIENHGYRSLKDFTKIPYTI
jgi:hypothetical protein